MSEMLFWLIVGFLLFLLLILALSLVYTQWAWRSSTTESFSTLRQLLADTESTISRISSEHEKTLRDAMTLLSTKDALTLGSVTRSLSSSSDPELDAGYDGDQAADQEAAAAWAELARTRGVDAADAPTVPAGVNYDDIFDASQTSFPEELADLPRE